MSKPQAVPQKAGWSAPARALLDAPAQNGHRSSAWADDIAEGAEDIDCASTS